MESQEDGASGQNPERDTGGISELPPNRPAIPRGMTFEGTDRTFPIRSIVSVDPSQSPTRQQSIPASPIREGGRRYSIIDADTWDQIQSQTGPPNHHRDDIALRGSPEVAEDDSDEGISVANLNLSPNPDPETSPRNLVTSRFEHVVTESGHAVATRPGEFQACEDEPIHIPGVVQSFGVMVALREEAEQKLVVRIASENSKDLLGYSPNELFALDSFCRIFKDDQADTFLDHIDFIRDGTFDPGVDGPEVFLLSAKMPSRRSRRFWCAIHTNPSNPELIICEFELEEGQVNPLSASDQGTPTKPSTTLKSEPTPEDFAGSTSSMNQPLRVLRNARRQKGEVAAMEVFRILTQIQDQLARTDTLDTLLNTATGLVKELTGFHRILIYRFDMDWNGMVVAELLDPRASKDLYKGLDFPASDIPKQARDLYRINKVRLLYDRDQLTSRIVCRTVKDLETPLNMTHSYLRAMSPIHVKYLANMEVRASMSISINGPSELWGLISCHSYGQSGMRVSFPVRKMCRLIGDTVSQNIERLSYASRLQARNLINTASTDTTDANPSGYIVASSDDLLKLFDADYGALCIRDETKILGKLPLSQEILALVEYLKIRQINSVVASHNITKDLTDLRYPPGFKYISGLLHVPLSTGGTDFIVFFRRGHLTEVKWAGNPYDKETGDGHLLPRKSFETWRETVLGQSREWTETDVDTAAVLCLVYGKFIKVWRQKEAAIDSSQFTQLLLANSAHEVRTPLNAIVNYLEIAMEGALDAETRDNLTKSYSASKSLIYVINDLLDLTNAEQGQNLNKDESFDLARTIQQATEIFEAEAKRKGITFNVQPHAGLPTTVLGDQRRIRQTMTNLISNAFRHTSAGSIAVGIRRAPIQPESGDVTVEMTVQDTSPGMSPSTLDALFQQLEQVSRMDDATGPEGQDSLPTLGEEQEKQALGLELALVARIVHNMHGQLSIGSEEGKDSRFKISLQFPVPDHERRRSNERNCSMPRTKGEADRPTSTIHEPLLVRSMSEGSDIRRNMLTSSGTSPRIESTSAAFQTQDFSRTTAPVVSPVSPAPASPKHTSSTDLPSAPETKPEVKPPVPETLRVLVAEDDPINNKIIQKRLGNIGHTVRPTGNGEECAGAYREDCKSFDVILMDIQMPIADGLQSTRMIRDFEKQTPNDSLSPIAKLNGQIPIFAVSASIFEKDAASYIDTGFDGWIMKPINFNRLNVFLDGLQDDGVRDSATYRPGEWEKGGWFVSRRKV